MISLAELTDKPTTWKMSIWIGFYLPDIINSSYWVTEMRDPSHCVKVQAECDGTGHIGSRKILHSETKFISRDNGTSVCPRQMTSLSVTHAKAYTRRQK